MNIKIGSKVLIKSNELNNLVISLKNHGYITIAPKIFEKTIIYDEIYSIKDLPIGWTDEQEKGSYSIKKSKEASFFYYNVGPYSWKKFLYPPVETILTLRKKDKSFEVVEAKKEHKEYAFIGVRACELNAIKIQDKIFIHGEYVNQSYKQLRENCLIIAVNCSKAGNMCFCTSTRTGPEVKSDFDLLLTEVINDAEHYFICEVGSTKGVDILKNIEYSNASEEEITKAEKVITSTIEQIKKNIDLSQIKEKLANNYENPYWNEIANRCLTCTNCTMVCPTCFCHSVEDVTDLTGEHVKRVRKWDSCFTMDFSYIHGNTIRKSSSSRYRQWLTHKFSTWVDQFDTLGCVGCGRCITWCPVGIDIVDELKKLT